MCKWSHNRDMMVARSRTFRIVREDWWTNLGDAVHLCAVHDDDVDDFVAMRGLVDNLNKLWKAL